MANLSILPRLCELREKTIPDLADHLGVTRQAVWKIVRTNVTRTSTLERICEFLDVPVTIFFDKKHGGQGAPMLNNINVTRRAISAALRYSERIGRTEAAKRLGMESIDDFIRLSHKKPTEAAKLISEASGTSDRWILFGCEECNNTGLAEIEEMCRELLSAIQDKNNRNTE